MNSHLFVKVVAVRVGRPNALIYITMERDVEIFLKDFKIFLKSNCCTDTIDLKTATFMKLGWIRLNYNKIIYLQH